MSKQTEPSVDLGQKVEISAGDLLQLFSKLIESQNKSQESQAKVIADAFQEAKKPYVDPKAEANRKAINESSKKQQLAKLAGEKIQQDNCPHEQGQTGDDRNGKSAFNFLKLPTGEWIGICTYCRKIVSNLDPRDQKFFVKRSGRPAEAGQFACQNPIEAALARLSPDKRKEVLAARKKQVEMQPNGVDG